MTRCERDPHVEQPRAGAAQPVRVLGLEVAARHQQVDAGVPAAAVEQPARLHRRAAATTRPSPEPGRRAGRRRRPSGSGSSISAIGPGLRTRRDAAADASVVDHPSRRCGASSPHPSCELGGELASPATQPHVEQRGERVEVVVGEASASFTVRTDCPSANPASHSGYQSAPRRRRSARRRRATPAWSSMTSTSEPGHSSRRAYEPSATHRPSGSALDGAELAARRAPSTQRRASAAPNAAPRSVVVGDELGRARAARRRVHSARARRYSASGPDSPGADPPHVLDRHDPDLAVADLAGAGGRR